MPPSRLDYSEANAPQPSIPWEGSLMGEKRPFYWLKFSERVIALFERIRDLLDL